MSVHPIVAPAREGDPADPREPLREAQKRLAAAKAALEMHKTAIARAEDMVEQAREKLVAADAGVSAAREKHAQLIAKAAVSGSPSPNSAHVRAARAAQGEYADEIETAELAVSSLRGHLAEFEEEIRRCEIGVIAARNQVLAPIAAQLVERAAEAKAEWLLLPQILKALVADDARLPELKQNPTENLRLRERVREPLIGVKRDVNELLMMNIVLGGPVIDSYAHWREKLLTDPDAQMPEAV